MSSFVKPDEELSASSAGKRKSSAESSDGSVADGESMSPPKKTSTGKTSASQQLVPVPGNPNAPMVTKRTLQNRKAQREFRKRREAKVKELEERCRRYDQMGVEANLGLQQIAKTLKEENEALKGLLARLGYAHLIPDVLENVNNGGTSFPAPQSFPSMDLSLSSWTKGTDAVESGVGGNKLSVDPSKLNGSAGTSSATSAPSGILTAQPVMQGLPMTSDSVNPSLLSESTSRPAPASTQEPGTFNTEWFAQLAQAGRMNDPDVQDSVPAAIQRRDRGTSHASQTQAPGQRTSSTNAESGTNQTTGDSNDSQVNPILSLNLNSSTPGSKTPGRGNNNSTKSLFKNFFTGLAPTSEGQTGSGLTGSAMIGGMAGSGSGLTPFGFPSSSTPGSNLFPMPLPTHQNDALLNPNPIPFAFNLSNPKSPPDQGWWNQMGGGQLSPGGSNILDEKAQAVAQATAGQNPDQSPFDLSAFLNGGLTPGGGFTLGLNPSLGNDTGNPLDSEEKKEGDASNAGKQAGQSLTPAEHAQMFLRLLEQKMTQRGTSPYASLGFQPPSQLTAHQRKRSGADWINGSDEAMSSSSSEDDGRQGSASSSSSSMLKLSSAPGLSPINIYSRLAQHPAFLSTNASELEELVESIGTSQSTPSKSPRKSSGSAGSGFNPAMFNQNSAAGAGKTSFGSGVEVDERAVNKMLGLLDQKAPRSDTYSFN